MAECIQESFSFTAHFSRRVEAGFTAGQVSSDGGAVLLRKTARIFAGFDYRTLNSWSCCGRVVANAEFLDKGNQLRLYLSALAYTLVEALRRLALKGTGWAEAQVDTIRLKLLKIGAIVRLSVRRVVLQLSSAYR